MKILSLVGFFFLSSGVLISCSKCKKKPKSVEKISNGDDHSNKKGGLISSAGAAAIEMNDLMALTDKLQELSVSPVKSLDKNTKRCSLDFDNIDKSTYICETFGYEDKPCLVANKECWKYPLQEPEDTLSILQLHDYIVKTEKALKNDASSDIFKWSKDTKKVSHYVMVIVASLVQLDYLATRLDHSPDFLKKSVLYDDISNYLRTLTNFINVFQFESGSAIYLYESLLYDPKIYFNSLVSLFHNKNVEMIDKSFEDFVDFFFEAFSRSYRDSLLANFIENCDYNRWIPLPIYYFRNRLVHEKPESIPIFIKSWMHKVWNINLNPKEFDPRYLVELGHLTNQSFLTAKTLEFFIKMVLCVGIFESLKYDSYLILSLSLISLAPCFQPLEGEEARSLFVDLSSPHLPESFHSFDLPTSIERREFLVETWRVFLTSADFSKITIANYEAFCKLIYTLDQIYPGISSDLWSLVNFSEAEGENKNIRQTGLDIEELLEEKMRVFNNTSFNSKEKIEFLEEHFSISQTIETFLISSTFYLTIFQFMSAILLETIATSKSENCNDDDIDLLIGFCVRYMDNFFKTHSRTTVFNYWINTLHYSPTLIFETLNDLWMNERFGKSLRASSLVSQLIKVIDHNKDLASSFMMILITKTIEHDRPAVDFVFHVPVCLTKDERSEYVVELFNAATTVTSLYIPDSFFESLGELYKRYGISYENVVSIMSNLISKSDLIINTGGYCFQSFLEFFIIPKTDKFSNSYKLAYGDKLPSQEEFDKFYKILFTNYFQLMHNNFEVDQLNSSFLLTVSAFMHERKISAVSVDDEAPEINEELLNILDLSSIPENLFQPLAQTLFIISIQCISRGIRKNQGRILLFKLAAIASIFSKIPVNETDVFKVVFFSFDILLTSLLSANVLETSRETDFIKIFFVFYMIHLKKFSLVIPMFFQAAKKKESLLFLYTTIIESKNELPFDCFDTSARLEKSLVTSFQIKYFKMVASLEARKSNSHLANILDWIQKGQMDEDSTKYLCENVLRNEELLKNSVRPLVALSKILESKYYSDVFKTTAIDLIFSKNTHVIVSYIFERRTQAHTLLFDMLVGELGSKLEQYLRIYEKEFWYHSFTCELLRYKSEHKIKSSLDVSKFDASNLSRLKLSFQDTWKSWTMNHASIAERYLLIGRIKYILNPIYHGMQNILSRSGMVNSSTHDLLCSIFSTILKGQTDHRDGIFVNGGTDMISDLMRLIINHIKLNTHRAEYINTLLSFFDVENDRKCILSLLCSMVSFDSIPFDPNSFFKIYGWFNSFQIIEPSGPLVSYETFFIKVIDNAFRNIDEPIEYSLSRRWDLSNQPSKPTDFIFQFLNQLFESGQNDKLFSILIHSHILDKMLEHGSVLDCSDYALQYIHNIVENYMNNTLFSKVITFLEMFPMLIICSDSKLSKNITIWSKLRKFTMERFNQYDDSNNHYDRLNFLSNVGAENPFVWEKFLYKTADLGFPNKFLIKVFVKAASIKKVMIEIVGLLPDELNIEDFEDGTDLRAVLSFIPTIIKAYQMVESTKISVDIMKKLLMIMEFGSRISCEKGWTWLEVIRLFKTVEFYLLDEFSEYITNIYHDLLFKSTSDSQEALSFIYGLNAILDTREGSFEHISGLFTKAQEVYDLRSGTKSISVQDHQLLIETLKEHEKVLNEIIKDTIISDMTVSKSVQFLDLIFNICKSSISDVRSDELAQASLKYALILLNLVYGSDFDSITDTILNEFCDKIVEFMALFCDYNAISIARTITELEIGAFVKFVGEYISPNLVVKFKKVLSSLYSFAGESVSQCIFDHISGSNFRIDLCLFPNRVIKSFAQVVKNDFDHVEIREWPQIYLDGISNACGDKVDDEHFDNVFTILLLNESEMETDDYITFFSTCSNEFFYENSEDSSDHLPIFTLVEKIVTCDGFENWETSIEDVFAHFFTENLMETVLKFSESTSSFMKLLSVIKLKYSQEYKGWLKSLSSSDTKKATLLAALEKNSKELKIIQIHTKIASDFVKRLEEDIEFKSVNDLKIFLISVASLNLESVRPVEMKQFQMKFAEKLIRIRFDESWREEMERAVNLLLTSSSHTKSSNFFEILFQLGRNVFSDKIFAQFVNLSTDNPMRVFEAFKDLINFDNFIQIFERNTTIKIIDYIEMLKTVALQSNLTQTLDFVKKDKVKSSLELEAKLNLLMWCKQSESPNAISELFDFVKSFQHQKNNTYKLPLIIMFMLRNDSLLSSFIVSTNAAGKNRRELVSYLRNNLTRHEYLKLYKEEKEEEATDIKPIGRIILNLLFKPSSTTTGFTVNIGCPISTMYSILENYVSDVKTSEVYGKNKVRSLVIGFLFFGELDTLQPDLTQERKILPNLVECLANSLCVEGNAAIATRAAVAYTSESIYEIVRLSRRVVDKRKNRIDIIKKILFSNKDAFGNFKISHFRAALEALIEVSAPFGRTLHFDQQLHVELLKSLEDKDDKHIDIVLLIYYYENLISRESN